MNGQPYSTYTANEVRFNPPVNEADFAITEEDRKASLALARDLDGIPIGVPNENPKEIAPGIVYVNGPIAFHSTEVRQSDGIVIVEAAISSGYSARIIEDARKRFPGLPIKALVTTIATRTVFAKRAVRFWASCRQPFVRPGKLLKMIVWRGGTRSDRASHRT